NKSERDCFGCTWLGDERLRARDDLERRPEQRGEVGDERFDTQRQVNARNNAIHCSFHSASHVAPASSRLPRSALRLVKRVADAREGFEQVQVVSYRGPAIANKLLVILMFGRSKHGAAGKRKGGAGQASGFVQLATVVRAIQHKNDRNVRDIAG